MIGLALVLPEDTDTTKLNVYENYNFAVMADISKQMLSVPDHHLMALVHVEGKETPNVEPQNDLMNVWEIKKEDLPGFFALTSEGKAIKYEDSDISDPSQVHPTVLLQWAETFWNTWDSENMQKLLDYHTETLLPQLTKNTKEWLDLDTKIFQIRKHTLEILEKEAKLLEEFPKLKEEALGKENNYFYKMFLESQEAKKEEKS